MRAWLVFVIGCGAQAAPGAPSNRATTEPRELVTTSLQIYVQDVRARCGARDHIEVIIDGRRVGTIDVQCRAGLSISAQARQFRLKPEPSVVEGWHRIGVRHIESGRAAAKDFAFPAGRPADPHEPWIQRDKLRVTFDVVTLEIGELSMF